MMAVIKLQYTVKFDIFEARAMQLLVDGNFKSSAWVYPKRQGSYIKALKTKKLLVVGCFISSS